MPKASAFKQHKEPDADEYGGQGDNDADDTKGKRTQKSVNYSPGTRAEHCGICRHFEPPHRCELVAGHIVPSYWCRLFWKAKVVGRMANHIRGKSGALSAKT